MMQFSVSQTDHSPATKEAIVTLMLYSQLTNNRKHGKYLKKDSMIRVFPSFISEKLAVYALGEKVFLSLCVTSK